MTSLTGFAPSLPLADDHYGQHHDQADEGQRDDGGDRVGRDHLRRPGSSAGNGPSMASTISASEPSNRSTASNRRRRSAWSRRTRIAAHH